MAIKNIRDLISETTALVLIEHIIKEEANLTIEEFSLDPRKWFKKAPATYQHMMVPTGIPLLDQAIFDFEKRENLEHMQAVAKSMDAMHKGSEYRAAVKAGDATLVWPLVLGHKYPGLEPMALENDGIRAEDVPDMLERLAYNIKLITKIVKEFEKGSSRWERAIDGARSRASARIMRINYKHLGEKASAAGKLVKWWEKVLASPKLMASFKHLSIANIKEVQSRSWQLTGDIDAEGFESFEKMQNAAERNADMDARDAQYAANAGQHDRDHAMADRYSKMSPGEQARHRERQLPNRLQSSNHEWWQR